MYVGSTVIKNLDSYLLLCHSQNLVLSLWAMIAISSHATMFTFLASRKKKGVVGRHNPKVALITSLPILLAGSEMTADIRLANVLCGHVPSWKLGALLP